MKELIDKWEEQMKVNKSLAENEELTMFVRRYALGKYYAYRDCIRELKKELEL